MDPGIYKLLHFTGIILLLLGLGGALCAGRETSGKMVAIFHGLGALLILVSGFGMQAKAKAAYVAEHGSAWPWWMIVKVVIWLLLGGSLVVAKRRLLPDAAAWSLVALLAIIATYLGLSNAAILRM